MDIYRRKPHFVYEWRLGVWRDALTKARWMYVRDAGWLPGSGWVRY